jgi:N-acetylmuramoyl-L-alanine amidase
METFAAKAITIVKSAASYLPNTERRKREIMRLTRFALFLIAALLISTVVSAQDEVTAQAYRTVNVRSGPGIQYDIIGQLTNGDQVRVIGRSDEENDWLQIEYKDGTGWVAYFTVTVMSAVDKLPIVDATDSPSVTPTPVRDSGNKIPASGDLYVTAFRRVNVRSGPGLAREQIGTLEPGDTADITGRTTDNQWLQINFNGQSGWVAYFVVTVTGSLNAAAVIDLPIENQVTPEPTAPPQITARYNINLRAEPMLDSSLITVIPFGTSLTPETRLDNGDLWLQVTYEGQTGWLLTALVNVNGNLDSLPVEPLSTAEPQSQG